MKCDLMNTVTRKLEKVNSKFFRQESRVSFFFPFRTPVTLHEIALPFPHAFNLPISIGVRFTLVLFDHDQTVKHARVADKVRSRLL